MVCVGVSVFESCFFFCGLKRLSFLVVELEAVSGLHNLKSTLCYRKQFVATARLHMKSVINECLLLKPLCVSRFFKR